MPFALPGFFRTLGADLDFSSAFLYVAADDSADLASILAGTYDFTTVGAINGTIVVATEEGTYSAGISLDATTTYDLYSQGVSNSHNGFMDTPVGYAIFPSPLSDGEIAQAEAHFVAEGAAPKSAFGSVTNFTDGWRNCRTIATFPLIDTSSADSFFRTWNSCESLISFPELDSSSVTSYRQAWQNCSSLTSFPLLNTSSGTNFNSTWRDCTSLTSFPLINTSSGSNLTAAWQSCTSLSSFPLIDTSAATTLNRTWSTCSSLTSFPAINASLSTDFFQTWNGCVSLTSFPLIDVSLGQRFSFTWQKCTNLTTFPAGFFDSWSPASLISQVFNLTWDGCTSLTAQSVENILTSLDTSGVYGTNTGASGGTQLSDSTIDIDYDGTTLSGATTTAIASLKLKDWAISINSVIQ